MAVEKVADLADQLGWCVTTRDHLLDVIKAVQVTQEQINLTIRVLYQNAPQELSERLKNDYLAFNHQADETIQHIHKHHIEYVNAKADDVREALVTIQNLEK